MLIFLRLLRVFFFEFSILPKAHSSQHGKLLCINRCFFFVFSFSAWNQSKYVDRILRSFFCTEIGIYLISEKMRTNKKMLPSIKRLFIELPPRDKMNKIWLFTVLHVDFSSVCILQTFFACQPVYVICFESPLWVNIQYKNLIYAIFISSTKFNILAFSSQTICHTMYNNVCVCVCNNLHVIHDTAMARRIWNEFWLGLIFWQIASNCVNNFVKYRHIIYICLCSGTAAEGKRVEKLRYYYDFNDFDLQALQVKKLYIS